MVITPSSSISKISSFSSLLSPSFVSSSVLFSSEMIFILSPEISFSFLILSIAFFIPIPNSLLTDNISSISNDISQISYLGFLLYLILSTNNVNSAKFSSFISVLFLNCTAFNPLNILTVSPVNNSASIVFPYHSQNSKKLLFFDIPSGIGKHLWHDPSLVLLSIPNSQSKLCFIITLVRVSSYHLVLSESSCSLLDPSVLYPSDSLLRYSS